MADGSSTRTAVRSKFSMLGWASVHVIVVGFVLLLNLAQQPGLITFDTKLDLQLDPGALLARSTSLWNPDWALGGLQNQASGYLFPMGPAFMLGELVGAPVWVWERLWSALVMLVAYEGARRLALNWPGIGPAGAFLAGLSYMLAPRVLTTVGGLSGETLPAAVLPWTVLPLVLYLSGRQRGWVAFVLSAATVPWMGGQNATLVLACMVFPSVLLAVASGRGFVRRVVDLASWGGLVLVATLWWVVPLLLLGSYAPPFLDFIESAEDTAGAVGWLSALRGTSHWVAFFPGGGQLGWDGGYELASSPWVLVSSVLVVALGLVGLLQQQLWQRRVLVVSVLLGAAVLTAGRGGWAGSVFADAWLQSLDTWLAPLRNIHKFDPVLRLPLALGVGAWATHGLPRLWRGPSWLRAVGRPAAITAAAALTLVAVAPVAGSLRTDRGFADLPDDWRDAVAYLQNQDDPTRTLVLPGTTFAVQTWGRTIDEPIQVLQAGPWLSRAQLSVASAGTVRLLESVEQALAQGRPQDRVTAALHALGITHVVVRRDLDPDESSAPDTELLEAALGEEIGTRPVAAFGTHPQGGPMLQVYEVEGQGDPRIQMQAWDERAVVAGGPEIVPELRATGLAAEGRAIVLDTAGRQSNIVTDSLRRVERTFGRVHDAGSGVMTADDPYRVNRLQHDYVDQALPRGRTTAVYDGASTIAASSSGAYADIFGSVRPEQHPYSAFDHSFYTSWVTAPFSRPRGQWVEARFESPTLVDRVSLTFDTSGGVGVTSVRVSTDHSAVVTEVGADGRVPDLEVGDDRATRLRITVVDSDATTGQVRLSDVRIEGHDITRSLEVPAVVSPSAALLVSSEAPRRACAVSGLDGSVSCDLRRQRETSETPGFTRTFTVGQRGTWHLRGRAIATTGSRLDGLFAPLEADKISVVASSTYAGDPAVNAAGAVDGRSSTGWTSAPGDPSPALQLTWGPKRRVTGLEVTTSPGHPGTLPETVVVDAGPGTGKPQLVATTGPKAGSMRAVRTDQLRVTAVGHAPSDVVAISELSVIGTDELKHGPDLDTPTGALCGFGPMVEVAGRVIRTRLIGTLGAVRTGAELSVIPCGGEEVALPPGQHTLEVTNPAGFAVTTMTLSPSQSTVVSSGNDPRIMSWGATERRVQVEADSESVLAVTESFNEGWVAEVDGEALQPVVLEGWRQGFVVPAGTSGVVELDYAPQTGFRTALVVGLALAAVLMLLAVALLLGQVRWRRHAAPPVPVVERHAIADARPLGRAWRTVIMLPLLALSLPLATGALLGWLFPQWLRIPALVSCAVALVGAAFVAIAGSSVVVPPPGSDVIAALVVGVVCGRVLKGPERL